MIVAPLALLFAMMFASPPQVGMNVTGVDYWAGDRPFVDLVRSASDWRVETDADGWGRLYEHDLYANGTFALTDGGYPVPASGTWRSGDHGVTSFRVLVPGGNEGVVGPGDDGYFESPVGIYTLFARGTGRLHLSGGGFAETTIDLDGDPVRVEVERTPGPHADGPTRFGLIALLATDAADPVRDVHLVMPGHAETFEEHPFNPIFLDRLRPFAGVRLMDWNAVNGSALVSWVERPTREWYSYSPMTNQVRTDSPAFAGRRELLDAWPEAAPVGGVPLEVQAELANALDCELWVCVPPLADDGYVRGMTRLLGDRLDPDRTLVVEYANEVYNRAFLVNKVARHAGGDAERYLARRVREVYAAVREEAGDGGRVKLVLPHEIADAYLDSPDALRVDAVIANAYWGIEFARRMFDEGWGEEGDEFLMDRLAETAMDDLRAKLTPVAEQTRRLSAERYPLVLWTYEGGSHFHDIWWCADVREATGAATSRLRRHPRTADLYREMFALLDDLGIETNYLFANTGGGFGHLKYPSQDPADAPKYRGAVEATRR